MNLRDERLWKSGREKVDAGLPLTDPEIEVLRYFGGDTALEPRARELKSWRSTKPRAGGLHRKTMDGQLHTTMLGKLEIA